MASGRPGGLRNCWELCGPIGSFCTITTPGWTLCWQKTGWPFGMRQGCLVEPPDPIEAARALPVYQEIAHEIEGEFADRAVSVLKRAGLHAWRNPVGHIAVGA